MDGNTRRTQLLALQQQCDLLEAQMEEIRGQLSEMKTQMSPLAPIYTLPDELLLLSLRMAFRHDFPHCRHREKWPRDSPLAISHVSRRWRAVAVSEPTIWSCIHLTGSTPSGEHGEKLFGLYLARSKKLPLSVSFDWSWSSPECSAAVGVDMLNKWARICKHSKRWSRISLVCPELKDMQKLLQATPPNHFFRLQCVCMTSLRPQSPWSEDGIGITGSPKFKQFWVDNVRIYDEGEGIGMFAQLTELKITRISHMRLHTLLQLLSVHTPSLVTFICGDVRLTEDSSSAPPFPASFPSLKHLALYRSGVSSRTAQSDPFAATLYKGFSASLETLHIGMEHSMSRLFRALHRETTFFPAVRTLQLLHYPYDPTTDTINAWDDTADILYSMNCDVLTEIARSRLPSVETFETSIPATQFLRSLIGDAPRCGEDQKTTADDNILWPALQTLSLCEVEEPVLLEFLEYRARTQHPIQNLMLSPKLRSRLSTVAFEIFATLNIHSSASYHPQYIADSIEVAELKYH